MFTDSELRKCFARFIRENRWKDLQEEWLSQERSLEEYCERLGIMEDYLKAVLQLRIHEAGMVSVLDVGMGKGNFLKELSVLFSPKIHLEGIALTHRKVKLPNYKQHIALIESIALHPYAYDYIFSVRGGLAYTLNSFVACETIFNSLKKEGTAFLEDRKLLLTQDWFRDYLTKKGFEVEVSRFEAGEAVSFKITRHLEGKIDFDELSAKYISLLNQQKNIFLQWGFDRLKQRSPLNSLFQELYSESHYVDLLKD